MCFAVDDSVQPGDYDLIIFDADDTLRECTVPGQPCPNRDGEWKLRPMVGPIIADHHRAGSRFGIASNQLGANPELGYMAPAAAGVLLGKLARDVFGDEWPGNFVGGSCGPIQFSTDFPDSESTTRKPAPGMLLHIMAHYGIGPHRTLMVGDSEDDFEAAQNAGCNFCWAWDFFGWPRPRGTE